MKGIPSVDLGDFYNPRRRPPIKAFHDIENMEVRNKGSNNVFSGRQIHFERAFRREGTLPTTSCFSNLHASPSPSKYKKIMYFDDWGGYIIRWCISSPTHHVQSALGYEGKAVLRPTPNSSAE